MIRLIARKVFWSMLFFGITAAIFRSRAAPQPDPLCANERRLDAGHTAPCSGLLVPTHTYAELLGSRASLATCEEKRTQESEMAKSRLDSKQAELDATEASRVACEALHTPKPPPVPVAHWYSSGGFVFVMGVVTGTAVVLGTVALLN